MREIRGARAGVFEAAADPAGPGLLRSLPARFPRAAWGIVALPVDVQIRFLSRHLSRALAIGHE